MQPTANSTTAILNIFFFILQCIDWVIYCCECALITAYTEARQSFSRQGRFFRWLLLFLGFGFHVLGGKRAYGADSEVLLLGICQRRLHQEGAYASPALVSIGMENNHLRIRLLKLHFADQRVRLPSEHLAILYIRCNHNRFRFLDLRRKGTAFSRNEQIYLP